MHYFSSNETTFLATKQQKDSNPIPRHNGRQKALQISRARKEEKKIKRTDLARNRAKEKIENSTNKKKKKKKKNLPLAEDREGSQCVGPASRRPPAAVAAAQQKKNVNINK